MMECLDTEALRDRYVNTMTGPAARDSREIIRANNACGRTLLTLRVLVQNRRKDKTPILVFGARAQLVSMASSTTAVLKGAPQCDNTLKFTRDE